MMFLIMVIRHCKKGAETRIKFPHLVLYRPSTGGAPKRAFVEGVCK